MGTEIDGYTTLVKEWIEHYEEVLLPDTSGTFDALLCCIVA